MIHYLDNENDKFIWDEEITRTLNIIIESELGDLYKTEKLDYGNYLLLIYKGNGKTLKFFLPKVLNYETLLEAIVTSSHRNKYNDETIKILDSLVDTHVIDKNNNGLMTSSVLIYETNNLSKKYNYQMPRNMIDIKLPFDDKLILYYKQKLNHGRKNNPRPKELAYGYIYRHILIPAYDKNESYLAYLCILYKWFKTECFTAYRNIMNNAIILDEIKNEMVKNKHNMFTVIDILGREEKILNLFGLDK